MIGTSTPVLPSVRVAVSLSGICRDLLSLLSSGHARIAEIRLDVGRRALAGSDRLDAEQARAAGCPPALDTLDRRARCPEILLDVRGRLAPLVRLHPSPPHVFALVEHGTCHAGRPIARGPGVQPSTHRLLDSGGMRPALAAVEVGDP